MRDFFHGWRRKTGCVTLIVAFAIYAAWMRSLVRHDQVALPWGQDIYCVESMSGQLDLGRLTVKGEQVAASWWSDDFTQEKIHQFREHPNTQVIDYISEANLEWRWDWAGFLFEIGKSPDDRAEHYLFPYWSLALPISFLSAYLILWKARKISRG